ncbi:MAG: EAL domain-containing protein [Oceanisphaera sp.]
MTNNPDKTISEARFQRLFADTQSMSIQGYRVDGSVVYWNAASERIYGYSASEVQGKTLYDLIIPQEMLGDTKRAVALMFANKQAVPSARLNLKHKNGSTVPVYSSHTVVSLPNDETIMFCMDADLRELEVAEAEVQRLYYYDSLTGLPNRRLILERIASAMRHVNSDCPCAALLIVDVDSFHSINDSLGYSHGDKVLINIAKVLQQYRSATDELARLGKDEFALFLPCVASSPGAAAAEAERLATTIINTLKMSVVLEGKAHHLMACVGIALFDRPNHLSSEELLRQANIALKMAKRSKKNKIRFFDKKMELMVKERLKISQALNCAIQNNELALALQPQVNAQRELVSFEALLRWQHPELGVVSPLDFIPIAEATGSIISMGDWVLEQSCYRLVRWSSQKTYEDMSISVNVSPVQFRSGHFIQRVQSILDKTGANPRKLRFELTENLMVDDIDFVVKQMESLRRLGISISLDDFGTGYASLAYLTRLPLDELKVDRVFVNNLNEKKQGALLAQTIISLGRNMNLMVIAEGVETQEQFERLRSMGCEYFQGYLFGKPTIESDF